MRSSYKKLGQFVEIVDQRNKDLEVDRLLGVSVKKIFIPSIANTVGANFKRYKIVKQHQFTYIPDTSRRGNKIGIALLEQYQQALVSQAYTVFKIKDNGKLDPEYLMMWFRRPEFDRYARYKSHGSVREIFDWDEMCEIELPIPSIEKQREIVAEYKTITDRIELNEKLNEKLEETAQAVYREWFVDFNFPDENGKPYKKSGGKMLWNEELEKDVPDGWEVGRFTKVINITGGGTPNTTEQEYWNGDIPFFTPSDVSKRYYSTTTIKSITKLGLNNSSTRLYPKNTVFITARGTVGEVAIAGKKMAMNQSCYAINDPYPFYTHQLTLSIIERLKSEAVGATFNALVTKDFNQQFVVNPPINMKQKFEVVNEPLYQKLTKFLIEMEKLNEFQLLLLSKMSKVEGD